MLWMESAPVWLFTLYTFAVIPTGLRFCSSFSAILERRFATAEPALQLLAFFLLLALLEAVGYFFFFHAARRLESAACRAILGKACCTRCGGLGRTYVSVTGWNFKPAFPTADDARIRRVKYRGAKATVCSRCRGTRREP